VDSIYNAVSVKENSPWAWGLWSAAGGSSGEEQNIVSSAMSTSARIQIGPKPGELHGTSKSLQKALRILLHVGDSGRELGVTQVAAALHMNKTTVHRLLNALAKFDLIEKNPVSERYRLGLRLHDLGTKAVESRTLRSEARPFLTEMSRRSKESVSLAVPGADGIVCLDRVDSLHTIITVRTTVGAKFPAHCTAIGKAALAYLPESDVDAILSSSELSRFTPSTLTRVSDLKKNLSQIRQRGYSLDNQELERGLSGVAAPVLTREGRFLAAVGIAGPTPRFRGRELAQKVSLAKEIAARISSRLGNP
jgi:IclR family transcriptional regulator, KDG regulon repressor